MRRILFSASLALLAVSGVALADRTTTVRSTSAQLDRVSAVRQEDGTWQATVCGSAQRADGGDASLDSPCVTCAAATWGTLPAACLAAFKVANTD